MASFPALTGFYKFLFLYFEPFSTSFPALMILFFPGAAWFYNELVPWGLEVPASLDARTRLAVWQLGNCYLLLGMVSSLVFRAIRDSVPKDLAVQERLVGALLTCLAIADVTHVGASFLGLPEAIRYDFGSWNLTTHGNITFTLFLFFSRLAWFAGLGRERYYYGVVGAKGVKYDQ
ncbi:hypothetical protein CYLTODRAFT_403505 [Cylindrobasidium torrendii FP15055 ss-10]|uniref:DUF7704 domain-containing protein n=1 Tax=Cylindrobasidium torrendii FP15055 ss-10 TaxID=1314674 RepID=A0A0D7AZC8_9AGAR|nr:hypothetical protein CYLTODRAFT_403505 [Cylindrobasidium torrendii FP15055 ss-10]